MRKDVNNDVSKDSPIGCRLSACTCLCVMKCLTIFWSIHSSNNQINTSSKATILWNPILPPRKYLGCRVLGILNPSVITWSYMRYTVFGHFRCGRKFLIHHTCSCYIYTLNNRGLISFISQGLHCVQLIWVICGIVPILPKFGFSYFPQAKKVRLLNLCTSELLVGL